MNNVDLHQILWLYVIHNQKPEFIHFLEENRIKPDDESFRECLKESIKCHHCAFTEYIQNNLLQKENETEIVMMHLKYHNFAFNSSKELNYKYLFCFLCKYDYISLVKNALNEKDISINSMAISKKIFNEILIKMCVFNEISFF